MATGWSVAARSDAVNAVGTNSDAVWVAAYTNDACTTEVSGGAYTRVEGEWPVTTTGETTTEEVEMNIPEGTVVKAIARHTTPSGGTPYDARLLTPNESYGSAGKLFLSNHVFADAE